MCYAKPGPRCSYHMNERVKKLETETMQAQEALINAQQSSVKTQKQAEKKLTATVQKLSEARQAYYTTPDGQKQLQQRIDMAVEHGDTKTSTSLKNLKTRSAEIRQEQLTAYEAKKHATEKGLSPSRLNDYMQCALQYRYRTIDRLPETRGAAAIKGTLVHKVLEDTFDLPPNERTLDNAYHAVEQEFVSKRDDPEVADVTPEEYSQWEQDAKNLVTNWFQMENPQRLNPHKREMRVNVHYDGMNLRGFVDRVDRTEDGMYRVVDYKTGKSPAESYQHKYLFQMKFYAFTLWKTTGVVPKRMQLVFLGDKQMIVVEPTEAELETFGNKLSLLNKSIKKATETGNFQPQKSSLCKFCDFKKHCPKFGGETLPYPAVKQ